MVVDHPIFGFNHERRSHRLSPEDQVHENHRRARLLSEPRVGRLLLFYPERGIADVVEPQDRLPDQNPAETHPEVPVDAAQRGAAVISGIVDDPTSPQVAAPAEVSIPLQRQDTEASAPPALTRQSTVVGATGYEFVK